ncbi:hypothetical protein BKA00_002520 [Actinomadura coerulea]|uniref:Uncharacterized protein n=1 Tax=Actinomadura coerulea TaxID=46159 RepID=A0A7X0FZ98_9ACTN|nr:hypothetical protein [Actinomadura coerulea]MBB6395606.1 hypothetical protein [Actinomadura coerulea]GGQ25167.1 hypothetical protein GCM10010187_46980 [Actinomadura coerulea]
MSGAFTERWYRLFLRAFPPGHRAEYGAEVIGTLLNGTPRRAPSLRETAGLLTAGFAARARAATAAPWWADGLQLGLLTLALANMAYGIADHSSPWWLAVSAALVAALLRGWAMATLPLALLVALSTGRAMLLGTQATSSPSQILGPANHDWVSLAPYGVLTIGAVALAASRPAGPRRLRARPLWWLFIPAASFALTYMPGNHEYGETWQLVRAGTEGALLLAGVLATAIARSPRWALAAAIYVLPGAASPLTNPPSNGQDTGYWLTLVGLLLAMVATAWRPQPLPERRQPR